MLYVSSNRKDIILFLHVKHKTYTYTSHTAALRVRSYSLPVPLLPMNDQQKKISSNREKDCPANLPNLHEKELIIMGFTALCVLGLLFFVAWATDDWQ